MTAQKPIARKEAPDYPFRRKYSLHKVWIALKNGESKTHYAKDCSASHKQLQWKHIDQVVFSQQESLADCERIEKAFRGQYRTIQIYRRGFLEQWPAEPIIKYVCGKDGKREVTVFDDSIPEDVHCIALYQDPPTGSAPGTPFLFKLEPTIAPKLTVVAPPPVEAPISAEQVKKNTKDISIGVDRIRNAWMPNK